MECITLSELIAGWALCIAIIFGIAALFLPECRKWLGLDHEEKFRKKESITSEIVAAIIIAFLFLLMIILLILFILCRSSEPPRGPKEATPTPTIIRTPLPAPTSTPTILKPTPTVVIDGTKFELYVFNSDYYWVAGKDDVHTLRGILTGKEADKQMVDYLREIHGDMKKKDAIICVGTASYDLTLKGRPFEIDRAENRAKIITDWMRLVLKDADRSPALYKLNLGHYDESPDSDDQRLIVIVGVNRVEADAPQIKDILSPENRETLKQKLKEKGFPFKFDKYSSFDLTPAS